jgi:gliding motility-associated-like protein
LKYFRRKYPKFNNFMKRIVALLVLGWAFHVSLVAQPTVSISSATPDPGEEFCLDVGVLDFTDILSMEFTIEWDSTVLEFVGFNNISLDGLSEANFDQTMIESGVLPLSWLFNECEVGLPGLTIADDGVNPERIFSICFRAIGNYGDATTVGITNAPQDIVVTRVNACPNNIGLFNEDGVVSTSVRPFTLIASQEEANEGDLVCVDFSVEGFDQLTSFQFSINWDPSILEFDNVIPLENLPNLSRSGFGTPEGGNVAPGNATVSWSFVQPNNPGVSLEDGTVIFQLCFRVVGACETSSAVKVSGTPTAIEVTNTVQAGFNITALSEEGKVQVSDCDPTGLPLVANCPPPANVNDEVCVAINAGEGFQNITDLAYLLEWNANILEFKEIRNRTNKLFNIQSAEDASNVANGIFGFDWEAPFGLDADMNNGEKLFDACFDVVGLGGNSPIRFGGRQVARVNNGVNIGIAPTNCEIEVIQPEGLAIAIDDAEGRPGDTICVGFTVNNLRNLTNMQFSLAFEPNHIKFLDIPVINLPGVDINNFNTEGADLGAITFQWDPASAQTVEDGTVVFLMCFEVTGTPGDCQILEFQDLPLESQVITTESNGNNVGLIGQNGEVCVLEAEGFEIYITDQIGYFQDTACVSLRVADFTGITGSSFNVNWEPSNLEFVSAEPLGVLGITQGNFNFGSTDVGLLGFNWDDAGGQTLPDTTAIFDVCFRLLGAPEDCYPVSVTPDAEVTTVNGRGDVKLVDPGAVCIRDTIIIEEVIITPVTCPDKNDGTITIRARKGGEGRVFFDWKTTPNQRDSLARFLAPGEVRVTIFDITSNPIIELDTVFTVPIATDLPFADAGDDQVITCDPPILLLEGSGNEEDNYSYSWRTTNGALPGQTNQLFVAAGAPGDYILAVTNDDTQCTARDTVTVLPAPLPFASAGSDLTLDCFNDTLRLDGSASAQADSIAYAWRALDGGQLVEDEDSLRSPRITAPGMYILEVINTNTACSAFDTVMVMDGRVIPNVEAGADQILECTEPSVLLDGSGSINEGRSVRYEWRDRRGNLLGTQVTYDAPQVGTYFLSVIDVASGCPAVDSVQVQPSPDFPVVTIAAQSEPVITCDRDTVTLIGGFPGENTTFGWTAQEGGNIVPTTQNSITPRVTAPGLYQLSVTDNSNGCTTTDTIRVTEDVLAPFAEAGVGFELTCIDTSYVLDGTGSTEGGNFVYTWFSETGDVVGEALQAEIFNPGTYTIEVKNTINGCTATDDVVITISGDRPAITFATPDPLTCETSSIEVAAVVTPSFAEYQVQWAIVEGEGNITNIDSLNISVDQPGNYRLRVINNETGCSTQSDVAVEIDTISPLADAGMDQVLTCVQNAVLLNGSNSASGPEISYQWAAVQGGETPAPSNQAQVQVSTVGTYELTVLDENNGCTATDRVEVSLDNQTPVAFIESPRELTCQDSEISLNATQSLATRSVASWTGLSGQPVTPTDNQLIVNITQPGSYEILLTDTISGCTATAMVEVTQNVEAPTADAGEDVILFCIGQAVMLDGSNSTQGADFTYNWTTDGNGNIIDGTTLNPTIDAPGVYQLEVTNIINGCNSLSTVNALLDNSLVDAEAGDGIDGTCEETEMLFGNALPQGTSGVWTSANGVFIETPDMPSTAVTGLQEGDNVFYWTLSTAECPEYSRDSVVIRREGAPGAQNDLVRLPFGATEITYDLVANDDIENTGGFTMTLIGEPQLGQLDTFRDGSIIEYSVKAGLFGESTFDYLICSNDCPSFCDTATVIIEVPVDPDYEAPEEPNTITPNGDGTNETFVFEVLDGVDPEFYPDNELIIFNRWGDIVYEAKPYLNDWDGRSATTGELLPDGTYYYILRLDISNGLIKRGDITIIR